MFSTCSTANVADSPILLGLIGQLRGADSMLHKLKLIALAWRTLRGLSPDERAAVASELGLEGAEKLIEQLGRMGGLSPSAVLAAVKRAEQADPNQLRQLLGSLSDVEGRRDVVDVARGVVEQWLEDAVPDGLADVGDDEEMIEADTDLPSIPTSTPTPTTIATEPREPVIAPVEAAPDRVAGEPPVPEAPPAMPVFEPAEPAPPMLRSVSVAARQRSVPTAPTAPAVPKDRRLILRLKELRSPIARLRFLSAVTLYARGMDFGELQEVIESFPSGWARRRALVILLKAEIPQSLPAALELVEAVADQHTWLWALTTLAARDLSSTDVRLLIAVAGRSPALQRRIRFLLGAGAKSQPAIAVD